MDLSVSNLFAFIRTHFFYDLKSSIISICIVLGTIFLYLLMKDKGDKVVKSLKYLTCTVIFFAVAMILQ